MRYEDLFIGILIIILLIVAALRILSPKSPTRALIYDRRGKLVTIGDHTRSEGKYTWHGPFISAPLELAAGSYRIDYQFETLTRLALLHRSSQELLFIKQGSGVEPLEILESGDYRFMVEPADASANWTLAYRQINVMNKRSDE